MTGPHVCSFPTPFVSGATFHCPDCDQMWIYNNRWEIHHSAESNRCWLSHCDIHQMRPLSTSDPVNHPGHYTSHPSGIECIQVTEHMGFCLGNAVKYVWRADLKEDAIEDLKKAIWYIEREIEKRINSN